MNNAGVTVFQMFEDLNQFSKIHSIMVIPFLPELSVFMIYNLNLDCLNSTRESGSGKKIMKSGCTL